MLAGGDVQQMWTSVAVRMISVKRAELQLVSEAVALMMEQLFQPTLTG